MPPVQGEHDGVTGFEHVLAVRNPPGFGSPATRHDGGAMRDVPPVKAHRGERLGAGSEMLL